VAGDLALIAGAAALGLASVPHCAAMCAAPCAAAVGRGGGQGWFQAARVAGYAAAGAVAAASVGTAEQLAQWSPALRPLWLLLQGALLVLGGWMLWQGRQPAWLGAVGREPLAAGVAPIHGPGGRQPWRAAAAGAMWVGWPCGLLQSALLLSSLTGSAASGASAMAGFAVLSSPGLVAAPWLWRKLAGRVGLEPLLVRSAGALLAAGALFALGHGIWQPLLAWCGLG
jgi:uncharacterized protein